MKQASIIFLVLCLSLVSVGQVFAATTTVPGGPYSSAMNIQNLGTAAATVTISYYNSLGQLENSSSHSIAIDDVLFVYVPNVVGLDSGEYSVVISSSEPVAAVSNFSDADSGASFSGFTEGSTSWFIPSTYDDYYGYFSEIYAQNVSGSALNITLSIYAPGSSTPVYSNTKSSVPANASVNWGQSGLTELLDDIAYSAKVTATGNIVAMANIFGSGATAQQLYSYNGFPAGGKTFYTPAIYKNYYGWNAAIGIQNVSTTAANVTVTYSNGTFKDYVIQPSSATQIYVPNEALPDGEFSAKITSDQDVAVMVNMSNSYNRAATYNGVKTATANVSVPNVMKRYYNYSSSVTCQNLGTVATTMTINYANQPGATKTSPSINPGSSWLIYLPNETLVPDGFNASATIVSNAAQPITCIVNSNMDEAPYSTQLMDQLFSYNGVNK